MGAPAKYTKQVIGMVEPSLDDQIREYASAHRLSISEVVRRAIVEGLPRLANPPGPEVAITVPTPIVHEI